MNIRFSLLSLMAANSIVTAQEHTHETLRADDHAPIAVMGDHYHEAGEFMFSFRHMTMSMRGNRDGGSDVSPATIATTVPNRFFGLPMQPPTLRVVPTQMTMDMQMVGLMYAPSDRVTLMGMLNHVSKEMDHVTYQGPAGTQVLGGFRTRASGLGDTTLAALLRLRETARSRIHLTLGLSAPTGDTDATGAVLAPTGMRPTLRLPYPMQLGSGTYDLLAGLTFSRFHESRSWGAQWRSNLRTGENDEGYSFGDEHRLSGWYSRLLRPGLSWSVRLEYFDRGNVDGIDTRIVAPVQTADPLNQGASRLDAGLGLNWANESGHRVALELLVPLDQDLDGPQLETDSQLTLGYQYAF